MKKILPGLIYLNALVITVPAISQATPETTIRKIYDIALTDSFAYSTLRELCYTTKGRIAGSKEAETAVEYCFQQLSSLNPDTIYLQEVWVPHWERGEVEKAVVYSNKSGNHELSITALGLSVGTNMGGITAEVIEVQNFEELSKLGESRIKGKIIFYNRPMDSKLINTFAAYGGAADQRTRGASEAAKYGAVGVIVRSLASSVDDFPHTGVLFYEPGVAKIPAVAVSTSDATLLSTLLKKDRKLKLNLEIHCKTYPDVKSCNIIAELKGRKKPGEIITVGGHLDAWDNSQGAHDDGAGCVQSMEVIRIFRELGIRPSRTIRVVMFMDEEIAQRGGNEYARQAEVKKENHVFALESDRGALTPLGFGFSGPAGKVDQLIKLESYFESYNLHIFQMGGGGVDIAPLRGISESVVLSSYIPDWQRYFEYHHSENDSFDKINFRELQLGSAAITSLIFLVDKFDL